MGFLVVDGISKIFGSGDTVVTALANISFEIAQGEFVAVMGESGAGKSTLLGILGAMSAPTSGHLVVDEIEIYGLRPEQQTDFRREFLGFIFQSFHLVPYLTVIENVMLPLAVKKIARQEKIEMAIMALEQVGLAGKTNRLPNQISGGESERVAIARAIVNEPPVLLADEPTGNLDSQTSKEIMLLLDRLNRKGMTIIMVTHSRACAGYANRLLHISDGRLKDDKATAYGTHKLTSPLRGAKYAVHA